MSYEKYPESFDVVVIGCGPAGASAAKFAAQNGAKTLCLEKKREVGLPVYDSTAVIYGLYECEEYAGFKFNRNKVTDYHVNGNCFISPDGSYGGYQPWSDGYGMRRPEFEKALAVEAGRQGAQILMDSKFLEITRDAEGKIDGVIFKRGGTLYKVDTKIVIACDSVYGRAVKQTNHPAFESEIAVSIGYDMVNVKKTKPMEGDFYELYLIPELPGYFCWTSPRGDDRFGVAVMCNPKRIEKGYTLRTVHDRFLKHLEELGRYDFSGAARVSMMSGTSLSVKEATDDLTDDAFLLAGDAAWRPMMGSVWGCPGMPTGVRSGRFAGEVAAQAIKDGEFGKDYLQTNLKAKYDATYNDPEKDRAAIADARQWYFKLMNAAPEVQNKAIAAVGDAYSALHLYLRGALPLAGCVDKIAAWWAEFEK